MHLDDTVKTIDSTLGAVTEFLPAYGELVGRFGPVLREQTLLREELIAGEVETPALDEARLAAGVPVLVGADCTPWAEPLIRSATRLLPLVADVLRLDDQDVRALRKYLDAPVHVTGLARALIEGDWKYFENTSVQLGLSSSQCLLYISENYSAPVFRAMIGSLGKSLSTVAWEHGYCPGCGSKPSISILSDKEKTDLDQLVGGGGKKYLHCSLCGHNWAFKRTGCPSCGNDKNETREVFSVDERKWERIEACHACGSYLLNIDLRECCEAFDPDAIQMGLIHLDVHAQAQGLVPMTRTLWNSLDS